MKPFKLLLVWFGERCLDCGLQPGVDFVSSVFRLWPTLRAL